MSRRVTVEVSETVYGQLARAARDVGRGTKPEHIAEEWLEQASREKLDLHRRFIEAGRIVDRRLDLVPDADG